MYVAGVDLAVARPSAVAVMRGCEAAALTWARGDWEIVEAAAPAAVVAIDAPLSLPPGGRGLRDVERELRRLGYRLLPPLMGSMRRLTERGIRLSKMFGVEVIEVHPLTSLKAMGLTRGDLAAHYGVKSRDLVDAIAAALTALAYLEGGFVRFGPFVLPTRRVCL
ncbi:MAG: DUF429 domain-containing protein [Pyrobaculum sp.]